MFAPGLLDGKRVLITGGGTGLGKAMGRRFLELGGDVVICGRREAVLAATHAEFERDFPGRAAWYGCDIRDAAAVEAMIAGIWADRPLTSLVNNAAGNFIARSETLSPRGLDAVLGIVLHGTAYVTLACGRRWLAAAEAPAAAGDTRVEPAAAADRTDGGAAAGEAGAVAAAGQPGPAVLSIITTYAWTGSAYVLPSAMAKAGVLAMTRSLAVEWGGRGIRLNAIAPGPFPTPGAWERLVPRPDLARTFETRNPLGRPGRHDELANLASFLLADAAAYITGEAITIDGGEWLGGAGQFNFLSRLTADDWAALAPRRRG